MQYFDSLPKIIYTNDSGIPRVATNIMARASILPSILKNPLVYYQYDLQEDDTPEIVAHKYYGSSYRYWIVLFANQLLDPQWDWPLSSKVFYRYIQSKYPNIETTSEIHHYEKIVTQFDINTQTTTVEIIKIDASNYITLLETNKTVTLPSGTVTISVTKRPVSIYDYELSLNESKRTISILNKQYVDQLETEFKNLMAA
jgi:hypothetical protein